MSDRFQFSQSKAKKWRACRRQYHFRYVEKLVRKVKARPLQFGTMVHAMLEADMNGEDPFETLAEFEAKQGKLFAAEKELYGDIIQDMRLIMASYFDYYSNDKTRPIRFRRRFAEHELEIPIDDDLLLVLKLDALVRTPNKLRWIAEHKTFSRQPNDDDRWRNLQSAVYIKACELAGMEPFAGMMWNYIKSRPPKVPATLKDGSLSIKDIDTLPLLVRQVIEERDLDPDLPAHQTLLERAEANQRTYFFRTFMPVKKRVVRMIFNDFVDTAREMMELHGKKKDRNIGMHCGWCDYEPICRAQLTGGDADFVKEREYEVSTREDSVVEKESAE